MRSDLDMIVLEWGSSPTIRRMLDLACGPEIAPHLIETSRVTAMD